MTDSAEGSGRTEEETGRVEMWDMWKSAPSERMGKGVPRRGDSFCKGLEGNEEMCFCWALRNLGALRVEAMGSDKGGEGNRPETYLEDNREPLTVHDLWRDRGRFVLCENHASACCGDAGRRGEVGAGRLVNWELWLSRQR